MFFPPQQGTTQIVKIQATDWEKIFVTHVTNKELASRTCKECTEINNPTEKWAVPKTANPLVT